MLYEVYRRAEASANSMRDSTWSIEQRRPQFEVPPKDESNVGREATRTRYALTRRLGLRTLCRPGRPLDHGGHAVTLLLTRFEIAG